MLGNDFISKILQKQNKKMTFGIKSHLKAYLVAW